MSRCIGLVLERSQATSFLKGKYVYCLNDNNFSFSGSDQYEAKGFVQNLKLSLAIVPHKSQMLLRNKSDQDKRRSAIIIELQFAGPR